jgi:hypothetical protein
MDQLRTLEDHQLLDSIENEREEMLEKIRQELEEALEKFRIEQLEQQEKVLLMYSTLIITFVGWLPLN